MASPKAWSSTNCEYEGGALGILSLELNSSCRVGGAGGTGGTGECSWIFAPLGLGSRREVVLLCAADEVGGTTERIALPDLVGPLPLASAVPFNLLDGGGRTDPLEADLLVVSLASLFMDTFCMNDCILSLRCLLSSSILLVSAASLLHLRHARKQRCWRERTRYRAADCFTFSICSGSERRGNTMQYELTRDFCRLLRTSFRRTAKAFASLFIQ